MTMSMTTYPVSIAYTCLPFATITKAVEIGLQMTVARYNSSFICSLTNILHS